MSDTFVLELALKVPQENKRKLSTRFKSAGSLYNACLDESLKRYNLMRQSKEYQRACALPKRTKERTSLFRELREKFAFSEYDLHKWLTSFLKDFPFKEHLDAILCQTIATRAFRAVKDYSVGKRKKPRFKNTDRMRSIEGKNNATAIRFKEGFILWKGLKLKPRYDLKDKHKVEAHALSAEVKYVRLIRKVVKKKIAYFAQLILKGKPLSKVKSPNKVVGIDLGPSSIAMVSEEKVLLEKITSIKKSSTRLLQRKIERSQKGSLRSKRLYQTLAEERRKETATRKREIGRRANELLALGNRIKFEKLSYVAWQKNYGKSVGRHAPGKLIDTLKRKAENAGAEVVEINTRRTKLSQTCQCGQVKKKSLNERWHKCPCGVEMQRDIYSAFLALHVEDNVLNRSQAIEAWPCAQSLMRQALLRTNKLRAGLSKA